jgi:hypothetical protein
VIKSYGNLFENFKNPEIYIYLKKPKKIQKFIETNCPCFTKDILPKGGWGGDFQKSNFGCFQSPKVRE